MTYISLKTLKCPSALPKYIKRDKDIESVLTAGLLGNAVLMHYPITDYVVYSV